MFPSCQSNWPTQFNLSVSNSITSYIIQAVPKYLMHPGGVLVHHRRNNWHSLALSLILVELDSKSSIEAWAYLFSAYFSVNTIWFWYIVPCLKCYIASVVLSKTKFMQESKSGECEHLENSHYARVILCSKFVPTSNGLVARITSLLLLERYWCLWVS